MNNIQIFNNPEFGKIRTVVIGEEPWFAGKDVCTTLGYARPDNAVTDRVEEDDRIYIDSETHPEIKDKFDYRALGQRGGWLINESGLYSLIFGSKLESAKKFKKWVTSEVLPSIRKSGAYNLPQTTEGKIALLAQGHTELKAEVDNIKAEVESIKNDLPILPIEADIIVKAVQKRGVEVMGGKKSFAYNDRNIRQKVYNDLYHDLKRNFNVRSYKAIKRKDAEKAVSIVEMYKPPLYLAEQIITANEKGGAA